MLTVLLAALAGVALIDGATIAGAILGAAAFLLAVSALRDAAAATGVLLNALAEPKTVKAPVTDARAEEPATASPWASMEPAETYEASQIREGLRSGNGHEGVPASTTVGDLPSRAHVPRLSEPE
jgi:hypothetical protein